MCHLSAVDNPVRSGSGFQVYKHEIKSSSMGLFVYAKSTCVCASQSYGHMMPIFYFRGLDLSTKTERLIEMIQPIVESFDYIFWGIEYIGQGQNSVLRIFIDHENGISVDDCAKVSHQVSAVMDVEDPITSHYTLEVSSPGVDRLLFVAEHFVRYRGQTIEIKLHQAFDGRRKFKGILNGIDGDDVLLIIDEDEFMLPIDQIDKARIVPVFDSSMTTLQDDEA
jgi:ribosome maturation factor RimP